mgnify:FL=1
MILMGEEPFPTCQGCKEAKTQTKQGQLINRLRLGQLKLANVYQGPQSRGLGPTEPRRGEGDALVARTLLEVGLNAKGKPALFVERLYNLPGKTIDQGKIENLIINYAQHLGAASVYWAPSAGTTGSWALKNKTTKQQSYKLLATGNFPLYRDSFGKEGKEKEAPAVEIPQRASLSAADSSSLYSDPFLIMTLWWPLIKRMVGAIYALRMKLRKSGDTILNSGELSIVSPAFPDFPDLSPDLDSATAGDNNWE